ncbi:MAG: lactone hydrolase, partial [Rhizobiales bacterium]|nr:lactone hydrolase [Hyphomicrobiales bacterium]
GGASLGGCVALAFAAAHGDRLDALALMDTTAWFGPGAAEAWADRADKAVDVGMRSLIDFHRMRWFSDDFVKSDAETVDAIMQVFAANDVEAYREACLMLGACDLRDMLDDFEVPVAVLVGREDFATPIAMAAALRDGIPGASFDVIEGARHLAAIEAPDVAAGKLRELISRLDQD